MTRALLFTLLATLPFSASAQNPLKLRPVKSVILRQGKEIPFEERYLPEGECWSTQMMEIRKVTLREPSTRFYQDLVIKLHSRLESEEDPSMFNFLSLPLSISIQDYAPAAIELFDDLRYCEGPCSGLTVELSSDGVCKISRAEQLEKLFEDGG